MTLQGFLDDVAGMPTAYRRRRRRGRRRSTTAKEEASWSVKIIRKLNFFVRAEKVTRGEKSWSVLAEWHCVKL